MVIVPFLEQLPHVDLLLRIISREMDLLKPKLKFKEFIRLDKRGRNFSSIFLSINLSKMAASP
jgi:hypothetical protein